MNDVDDRTRKAAMDLLAHVAAVRAGKIAAIETAARMESMAIVGTARTKAGERLRATLMDERRQRRAMAKRASGETDAAVRREENRLLKTLLENALFRLEHKLNDMWGDPAVQSRWLGTTLDAALKRLGSGIWRLGHPPEWEQGLADAVLSRMAGSPPETRLELHPDPGIHAGFRVVHEGAMVDATVNALLADRGALEGMLLGLLERTPGWHASLPNDRESTHVC